jgi:hypothetical protein
MTLAREESAGRDFNILEASMKLEVLDVFLKSNLDLSDVFEFLDLKDVNLPRWR